LENGPPKIEPIPGAALSRRLSLFDRGGFLMSFTVINPATGREGNRYEATSEDEIIAAIEKADAASREGSRSVAW
jgi:acyl-CoA reductase-like NAD-dependent aldehyde dehydrogenase